MENLKQLRTWRNIAWAIAIAAVPVAAVFYYTGYVHMKRADQAEWRLKNASDRLNRTHDAVVKQFYEILYPRVASACYATKSKGRELCLRGAREEALGEARRHWEKVAKKAG